jgi:glycosyltransferase involved in cell wall biosynthesis
MRQTYGEIESPVIFNGIDTSKYQPSESDRQRWREKNDLRQDDMVFTHVARFCQQKNHRMLIESFSTIAGLHPRAVLLLVGDGVLRDEMRALVEHLNLQHRVRFLGLRTDVSAILNACDVFVLSSDWEGLPISVLEAMAAAKPVIATDVGGIAELVTPTRNGYLIPRGNQQELVAAMSRMCEDGATKAAAMGAESRRVAVERFDVREMARQYGALYLRVYEARTQQER